MKKIVSFIILICLSVSANLAGDVRISAKSTLVDETEETVEENTWWSEVCEWVESLF